MLFGFSNQGISDGYERLGHLVAHGSRALFTSGVNHEQASREKSGWEANSCIGLSNCKPENLHPDFTKKIQVVP
jgi:hypothetical protein